MRSPPLGHPSFRAATRAVPTRSSTGCGTSRRSILPRRAADPWYRDIGGGMGAALNTAQAMGAYTISERRTWLSFGNRGDLAVLVENDPRLLKPLRRDPARSKKAPAGEAGTRSTVCPLARLARRPDRDRRLPSSRQPTLPPLGRSTEIVVATGIGRKPHSVIFWKTCAGRTTARLGGFGHGLRRLSRGSLGGLAHNRVFSKCTEHMRAARRAVSLTGQFPNSSVLLLALIVAIRLALPRE